MICKTLCGAMLLVSVLAGPAFAASGPVDRVDALVRAAMAEQHIPGLQIAVVKDGKVVMSRAYGVADLTPKTPVTADTVFPINSITKAFTGVAAMREVEAGRLDLSAPISTYVKDLPQAWRGVTIRQLLSHTSGLPNFVHNRGGGGDDEAAAWNAAVTRPVYFPPGERFNYSQTNYALVQMAINGLRGRPLNATLAEEQFGLAGLTRTGYGDSRDAVVGKAVSYGYQRATPDAPRERTEIFTPLHRAASGMNSTADDMARWMIAMLQGKLLGPAATRTLWTPVAYNDGRPGQWAMGWLIIDRPEHPAVGMTGGSRAAMFLYPDDGVGVVILTNLAGAAPEDHVDEIAQAFIPGMKLTGVAALRVALAGREGEDVSPIIARLRQDPTFKPAEVELNDWGYRLLAFGKPRTALAVLKLAADLYPASGNAFDSLADAYEANGDRAAAIANYRRSLELDPKNTNATDRLKKLESGPA
jgi:CubicO group peptidase (beta-lactamase class C family)